MRWSQKRQKTQTATSGNDLLLLQKIRALENVLSEAQSLLVDVRGLLAESEAKDQKKRQQHQEKKSQEECHLRDSNHILQHRGSVGITPTSGWIPFRLNKKITSMVTFSFSHGDKNTKDSDRGLLERGREKRRTHIMLTASELGIVALGYSDGNVALYDSSGERLALWNADTGGSPVVKLAFQNRRDRSALVALGANGCLASFEIGAWRWGRCISGGGVVQQQLDERLKNEMKDDYWNVFERGEIMSNDGLVVAIRSIDEQRITKGGWCEGDPTTAVEPIVIGSKEDGHMKLILAVGNSAGKVRMIRASDGLTVASFPQVLLHDDNERGAVISLKRSGSHLAAAFNGSSSVIIYRIPRSLISDATVDKKGEEVVPLEINTYGGCNALTNVVSLSFDRMVRPSLLFVGLDNGHVISIVLKTFTYKEEVKEQNLNAHLPCHPQSTTVSLSEAVLSLDAVEGYVLAGGASSAVMLNATSVLSLGLSRAVDIIGSTTYSSSRTSMVMTSISDGEGTRRTRRGKQQQKGTYSTSVFLAVGNSNGVTLYETLLPQVARHNHNYLQLARLPVIMVILLVIVWQRLRNRNEHDQKGDEDFLMSKEADLRTKQIEMELSRAQMRPWGRKKYVNHKPPHFGMIADEILKPCYGKSGMNHQSAHLRGKSEDTPSPLPMLEEDKEAMDNSS